jgi:hypothetical protein
MVRSCETVRAGAFFPQAQLQVPQKAMRQHRRQHMVMPAGIFAHFIVGHPKFRLAFFEALLHGPPHPTEPDQGTPWRTDGGITDIVGVLRCGKVILAFGPCADVRQANGATALAQQPVVAR